MESNVKLGIVTRLGYGTGHVLNDMTVTMWFSYFLLFFHNVIQSSDTNAGLIIMIGQVVDGISSILVGIFSDKDYDNWIYLHYGKRKVMHFISVSKQSQINIFKCRLVIKTMLP